MIKEVIKRELRSMQTYFPGVRRAKFAAYNLATKHFGWRVEDEFRLLRHLPPGGVAVDVGGNWGQSIHALQRYANPRKIVSFEPNPVLAAYLKNKFRDIPQVEIEPVGLGESAGEFALHVPSYRRFEYDGLASLDREEAANWLSSKRMARFDRSKLKIEQHKVLVRRLDDYDLLPTVIKIDVQGLEEAVVRGGLATIERAKPVIIIEAPSEKLIGLVSDLGLECFGLKDGRLIRNLRHQSNCIFLSDAHQNTFET